MAEQEAALDSPPQTHRLNNSQKKSPFVKNAKTNQNTPEY